MTVDLEQVGSDGCNGVPIDWDAMQISGVRHPENGRYVGMTVAAAAAAEGRPPAEFCYDLLVRDELGTSILMHVGHEDNVRAIMRQDHPSFAPSTQAHPIELHRERLPCAS